MDRRHVTASILLTVLSIILAAAIIPTGFFFIYTARAGASIDGIYQKDSTSPGLFYCEIPPVQKPDEISSLQKAVNDLALVINLQPGQGQPYLLSGRAFCLMGKPYQAFLAFERYASLHPKNPVGYLEMGWIMAKHGRELMKQENSADTNPETWQPTYYWRKAGINLNELVPLGDQAYLDKNYTEAARWYDLANSSGKLGDESAFRAIIAEMMAGANPIHWTNSFDVKEVSEINTIISSQKFRWFSNGSEVDQANISGANAAALWVNGDQAFFLVMIPVSGDYCLILNGLNSSPAPIQRKIMIDNHDVQNFIWSKGNYTWENQQASLFLDSGVHMIGMRFFETFTVENKDENAFIHTAMIKSSACPSN